MAVPYPGSGNQAVFQLYRALRTLLSRCAEAMKSESSGPPSCCALNSVSLLDLAGQCHQFLLAPLDIEEAAEEIAQRKTLIRAASLSEQAASSFLRLHRAGTAPLDGVEAERLVIGDLCLCLIDRLDSSFPRSVLKAPYTGPDEGYLRRMLQDLVLDLAAEAEPRRVQGLLDLRDALKALEELFSLVGQFRRLLAHSAPPGQ